MKKFLCGYGCFLMLLPVCKDLHAQQLPVTQYSSREGNSVVGALSIFQDKQGMIWFVNGYDVVRYDGHSFKAYPPAMKTRADYIYGLLQVDDEIWVKSYPQTLKISGDSLVSAINVDSTLKLEHSIVHHGHTYILGKNSLYLYHQKRLQNFNREKPFLASNNATLIPYLDSVLLTWSSQGNLIIFDLHTKTWSEIPMGITQMHQNSEGNIYLLVNKKDILQLKNITRDKNSYQAVTSLMFSLPENIQSGQFIIDRQHNFWAAENYKRLIRISSSGQITSYTEAQGLPSVSFFKMFIDREDNLWIGFNGGICKINNNLWERFTSNEGLLSNQVGFISSDESDIFFGSINGTNVYKNNSLQKIMRGSKPFIADAFISYRKRLFYSRDSILYSAILDTINNKVVSEKALALIPKGFREFKRDSAGTIFLSTNRGLFAWHNERLQKMIPDTVYYRKIFFDSRNHLWIGQFGGPLHQYGVHYESGKLSLRKIQTVTDPSGLPLIDAIRAITEDRKGNIIVGTRFNGLFYLQMSNTIITSITHYDTKDGLSSKSIWGLATADDGKIWISTAHGMNSMYFKGNKWIIENEGRQRQVAVTADILSDPFRNRIWVVTHPGVIYFDASKKIPSFPFNVNLSVNTGNAKKFNGNTAIQEFPNKENNFSFEFSVNSYVNEKAIQYTYRLAQKGNEEWSLLSTTYSVNFPSLSPGNYVFEVKALNANNEWSANTAVYRFEITPPFWQRAWFISLMVLALAGSFYLVYRYRVRRMKELFEMRNMIARDLHDEVGSTLTSINILSQVSFTNLDKDREKASSLLQKVIHQSHRIQQNMSDIVWAIRPDNDKIENMILRMREYLAQSLEPKNIAIEFIADETLMSESLNMQQRRDLFLIFKEAVNNIAKYSNCKNAGIRFDRLNGNIRLLIQDDGIGFDPGITRTSNGIENMHRRASLIKGSLNIRSILGEGTTIQLLFPEKISRQKLHTT